MIKPFDPRLRARVDEVRHHPNVEAIFRVIRQGESSQFDEAFFVRWGGTGQPPKRFTDTSDHPRILEPGPNGPSSAAGFAQITMTTFDDVAPRIGVKDFSPESQCLITIALIIIEGAMEDLLAGRLRETLAKCAGRWASFPDSLSGQPTRKYEELERVYLKYGGSLSPVDYTPSQTTQPAAPIEERDLSSAPPRVEPSGPSFMDNVSSAFGSFASAVGPTLTAAAPVASVLNPGVGLALGLAGKLIEMFEPLAREKVTKELSRHTDPTVAAKVADNLLAKAKELSGHTDPIMAVADVAASPAKIAMVQADVLDDLERMAPMLERIHSQQRDEWTAEESSRDTAAARAKTEPWDMTKVLVGSMLLIVTMSFGFLFWLAGYQAINLESKEPTALIWSSIVYVLGVVTGIWLTVIAYRFGSSRSSVAKDVQITELARRGARSL